MRLFSTSCFHELGLQHALRYISPIFMIFGCFQMLPSQGISLIREFKHRVNSALPGRVSRVVLFGSRARGEASADSDWDVAVFLKDRASSWDTLILADLAYDLIIESGEFIQPIALSEKEGLHGFLNNNIKADGIVL